LVGLERPIHKSLGEIWNDYSLRPSPGRIHDVVAEFERLLQE
jgi:hypothetical protein